MTAMLRPFQRPTPYPLPVRTGRERGGRLNMSTALLVVQTLNGLQLGVLLFLIAAGLTLVFGVMDFINLAHGVQYMVGAYLAAMFVAWTGSFWTGLALDAADRAGIRAAAGDRRLSPPLRPRSPRPDCSRPSASSCFSIRR